ncbi:MAG: hypothetical protein A2149_01165 [Candidatus Schekmanbacteria bacterium RBG_16_38_11]|uniref:4-vinyl reductase 4VR domain-containing protein n=2 Tax=Candidatus Schekmaniibacteriota TaxID=1817811 RepID=A0A1F7RAY6_9BACT|nr:MAG: hypothetical protein A2042_00815 [Candidatus Schekmanbacteria bacterium GWA2_38_11]OGL47589.1 MAG: hypothetical protein A2149_01165 [Candidatus Schekmanbacteria bacterium RBG_16_38_11]
MTRYLEPFLNIEGEEPLFGALKRINRSIEEQGRANFNNFIAVDYFLYNGMEKGVGKEKAMKLHSNLWKNYPPQWVKNALLALNIGEVKKLSDLARVIEYCQTARFCNFIARKNASKEIVGKITLCPFVEVTQKTFGAKKKENYFESLHCVTKAFIEGVVQQAGWGNKLKVEVPKAMCRGDKFCKVICSPKD